jgi:predicted PurR-regulated permease PerM
MDRENAMKPAVEPSTQAAATAASSAPAAIEPASDAPEPRRGSRLARAPVVVLAVLASLYALHWAATLLIPMVLALLVNHALAPIVDWLEARRIPRTLGALVLILGLLGGTGWTAYAFSDDAASMVDSLPPAAEKLGEALRNLQGQHNSPLTTVQKAATRLERAAEDAAAGAAPAVARGVQRVVVESPKFAIKDYIWSGTLGLATLLGQLTAVALLSFFLLASGDSFRRKLVKLAGPTLTHKRITLEMLNEINAQVRRYLLVQLVTCVAVGVATGLCFWALGLQNAALWGLAAGLLDLVPYVGGVLLAGTSALVAFMQFGSLQMGLLVAGVSIVIHTLEGMALTPWLTSRAGKMNPLAIFMGVLVWGWLWGPWGLLLGLPILMVVKAVCDRVESFKPVGELLGDES